MKKRRRPSLTKDGGKQSVASVAAAATAAAAAAKSTADANPGSPEGMWAVAAEQWRKARKRGCQVTLHAMDTMGNLCTSGGARVECDCVVSGSGVGGKATPDARVECSVTDHGDGTYLLQWTSKVSGTYEAHVLVDGLQIVGSPSPLQMVADIPDLTKAELSGSGLEQATAGKYATFSIACKDRYGNSARPTAHMRFEMVTLPAVEDPNAAAERSGGKDRKSKEDLSGGGGGGGASGKKTKDDVRGPEWVARWKGAEAHPHTSTWVEEEGVAELLIKYALQAAGDLELHVWCINDDPSVLRGAKAEREALPGSPFSLHCRAGKAHAAGSSVDRFSRAETDDKAIGAARLAAARAISEKPLTVQAEAYLQRHAARLEGNGSAADMLSWNVMAGEGIVVRPNIRDKLGNSTAAPDGALSVRLATPDDATHEIAPTVAVKGGLTTYEVCYEPEAKGWHSIHVTLAGAPIEGSPVEFNCIPGMPDVTRCRLTLPTEPELDGIKIDRGNRDTDLRFVPLFAGRTYKLTVFGVDKCGNELDRGGSAVTARITSIGGVAPPKNGDNHYPVEDNEDGSYSVMLSYKGPAELKVVVSIDKPATPIGMPPLAAKGGVDTGPRALGGEFAPILVTLLRSDDAGIKKQRTMLDLAAAAAASSKTGGNASGGQQSPAAATAPMPAMPASQETAAETAAALRSVPSRLLGACI